MNNFIFITLIKIVKQILQNIMIYQKRKYMREETNVNIYINSFYYSR